MENREVGVEQEDQLEQWVVTGIAGSTNSDNSNSRTVAVAT